MAKLTTATISKRTVEALAVEKDTVYWDSELSGFGVRAYPSGSKYYVVQTRANGKAAKRVTVGRHGIVTAEEARRRAALIIARIKAGEEPLAEPAAALAEGPTVGEIARRWLEEHVKVRCKPRTVEMYTLIVRKHLLPALGRVPALAVDHGRVAELHHSMRGTPSMANRTVEALSRIWNSAEDRGELPEASNPCRLVVKNRERGRERFLSEEEFRRLGRALAEAEARGRGLSVHAVAAIRLLLLTGLRRNEVLTLRWRDVDLDARELKLEDSKTGARVAPLSPEAARVLAGIPRVEGNPHVIPGQKPGTHLRNLNDPWDRIRRSAKLEDVRLHDCRHSFASRALALGEGLTMIGKLLGHTKVETTARYAHLARESVRESAIRVSDSIAADILKGYQVDGGDEAPAGTAT